MGEILVAEGMKILVQAVVGSLLGALFLRWAAHIVVKESPTYGTAYLCSFLAVLINRFLGLGVGLIAGSMEASDASIDALAIGMIPVSLLIAGSIVSHYLGLPYSKSLLVVFLQFTLTLLVLGLPILILVLLLA